MKKMTSSMLLASALTLGTIAVPSILAATTASSTNEEISEETKTTLDEFRAQEKAGEITHEEAHAKIVELGIDRPFGRGGHHGKGPFGNIDEDARATIEDIRNQFKDGVLTEEEAQAKLDDLDVDLPEDFLTHVDFEDLDEETKVALTEIRDQFVAGDLTEAEAQAKVAALGLDFDAKFLTRGPHPELTDDQKAQLDSIRDQVEAGTLTEEEARTQMDELGFKPHGGPGHHGDRGHHGPRGDFPQQNNEPADDEPQATFTTSEA
ncbi:hypothetical protein [Paenisporosarcina sp.]|uniref:hypothetical protein n=1 Tax=Paenisporosarcina sp. TaxID=1932001 RepID=UPI003C74B257